MRINHTKVKMDTPKVKMDTQHKVKMDTQH